MLEVKLHQLSADFLSFFSILRVSLAMRSKLTEWRLSHHPYPHPHETRPHLSYSRPSRHLTPRSQQQRARRALSAFDAVGMARSCSVVFFPFPPTDLRLSWPVDRTIMLGFEAASVVASSRRLVDSKTAAFCSSDCDCRSLSSAGGRSAASLALSRSHGCDDGEIMPVDRGILLLPVFRLLLLLLRGDVLDVLGTSLGALHMETVLDVFLQLRSTCLDCLKGRKACRGTLRQK